MAGAVVEEPGPGFGFDERLVPPTTPPTTAATITRASTTPNINQKSPLLKPHILRVRGSGGEPAEWSKPFEEGPWGDSAPILVSVGDD